MEQRGKDYANKAAKTGGVATVAGYDRAEALVHGIME